MALEASLKNKRSLVLSCFRGGFGAGRSRKSKTVPVDDKVDGEIAVPHRKSFLERVRKAKARRDDNKEKSRNNQEHPQAIPETNKCKDSRLGHITISIYNSKTEPAPLFCVRDVGETTTAASHSSSPDMKHSWWAKMGNGLSSWAGAPVITVVLLLVVIFGRACAVFCLCAWFYALARLRVTRNMEAVGIQSCVSTLDLEMDKKRIVLQGLLRSRRRY